MWICSSPVAPIRMEKRGGPFHKGGTHPGDRPLARGANHESPRAERSLLPPSCLSADRRPGGGLHRRRRPARPDARSRDPARRQGLRQRRRPPQDREHGSRSEHSTEDQPTLEELLLALPVPRPQRHRAHVRTPQGFSQNRNSIRPQRPQLPRRPLSRRYPLLLVMSPNPRPERGESDSRIIVMPPETASEQRHNMVMAVVLRGANRPKLKKTI